MTQELLWPRLHDALGAVAGFLDVDPAGLVFQANVTDAVAVVLHSMNVARGDEILSTSHTYGAVARSIEATCTRTGARWVTAPLPCPVASAAQVHACIMNAVTARTRLAIIDQVTSGTALRLPLDTLVPALRRRGIEVFVDGAHAAGMLPRPVHPQATWWTGNLHKWGLAPLTCAVLYTHRRRRGTTRPIAPSHLHTDGYQKAFSWQGTRDVTPWLTAPNAIELVHSLDGWPALRRYNAAMARWARHRVLNAWSDSACAASGPPSMCRGIAMTTLRLPPKVKRWRTPEALRDALAREHMVEVPIWSDGTHWWVRISCQAYTRPRHVDRFIDGIEALC
jgi:isopenicillin-N epimerase